MVCNDAVQILDAIAKMDLVPNITIGLLPTAVANAVSIESISSKRWS